MPQAVNNNAQGENRRHLSPGSWTILTFGLVTIIVVELVLCASLIGVAREEAGYRAEMRLASLSQQLDSCVNATNAMALVVQEANGSVSDFEGLAATILADHGAISSVQLAPDGVVTQIYPEAGNEAGKIDLFADPDRAADAIRARDTHQTIVAGPFQLKQGGTGLAVRKPVYLKNDSGYDSFWGFTIVIIMSDKLIEESNFSYLDSLSYMYRLTADTADSSVEVSHSQEGYNLDDPVSASSSFYGKNWILEVQPKEGWLSPVAPVLTGILLVIIILLLVRQQELMTQTKKQNVSLHVTSGRDALTGLYNRRGFDEAAQALLDEADEAVFAALDVNAFKLFNDLYGHAAGDALLVKLAQDLVRLAGPGALVARGGGDEFQIVLPGSGDGALGALEAYANAQQSFSYEGDTHPFGVSLGYARYPQQAQQLPELGRKADRALYHCKATDCRSCLYEEAFEQERREALAFNANDIAQGMPVALIAYAADDGRILFANPATLRLLGCGNMDDLQELARGSFDHLLAAGDEGPAATCRRLAGTERHEGLAPGTAAVSVRLATTSGVRRHIHGYARLANNEHYGSVCFLTMVDAEAFSGAAG